MRSIKFRLNRVQSDKQDRESGIALLTVLLVLMLITAIGFTILFMSSTETSINSNYRDTQKSFFGMRAGLEEVRDRLRAKSFSPITLPTTMPGSPGSIVYVTNPAAPGDVINPSNAGNQYFDDEFCHESFTTLGPLTNPGANVACPAASAPPPSNTITYPSIAPYTNTAASMPYKWVRITKKQNGTINGATVDSTQPLSADVCYNSSLATEVASTGLPGGGYPDCIAAEANAMGMSVYIVTSLAITPKGSRRLGQYEMAGVNISPPPGALGLDGPGATFSPRPSSNNFFVNGIDTGAAGYAATGGTGTCSTNGTAMVPAVSTGDAAGTTSITNALNTNPLRSPNYTGSGGTPSVVNAGVGGTGLYGSTWSSPTQLNNLVASLAPVADVTYSCGIGAPCTPTGAVGTSANPTITYVNGDFNFGNASGAGILIVTGTLSFNGNATYNGLILVIGQGIVSESGGGNGGFNGALFLAKTNDSTAPYAELPTLGSPIFGWNGGATSFIQYNSCWANLGNHINYLVLSAREEMY